MTTFPNNYDKLLFETVHAIVVKGKHLDLAAIKDLLDSGANPKYADKELKITTYDLVNANNQSGMYNGIIESFDEHISSNPREMDSVEEGMHLRPEEDES